MRSRSARRGKKGMDLRLGIRGQGEPKARQEQQSRASQMREAGRCIYRPVGTKLSYENSSSIQGPGRSVCLRYNASKKRLSISTDRQRPQMPAKGKLICTSKLRPAVTLNLFVSTVPLHDVFLATSTERVWFQPFSIPFKPQTASDSRCWDGTNAGQIIPVDMQYTTTRDQITITGIPSDCRMHNDGNGPSIPAKVLASSPLPGEARKSSALLVGATELCPRLLQCHRPLSLAGGL